MRQARLNPLLPGGAESTRWQVKTHTREKPTTAFGTVEFQGGPHPTKARVSLLISFKYTSQCSSARQLFMGQF